MLILVIFWLKQYFSDINACDVLVLQSLIDIIGQQVVNFTRTFPTMIALTCLLFMYCRAPRFKLYVKIIQCLYIHTFYTYMYFVMLCQLKTFTQIKERYVVEFAFPNTCTFVCNSLLIWFILIHVLLQFRFKIYVIVFLLELEHISSFLRD